MVRLTDRPDMTLDVYRGRKTIKQQTNTTKKKKKKTFYKDKIIIQQYKREGGGSGGRATNLKLWKNTEVLLAAQLI